MDTWSFGCVLSVVATWIVLGVKGIEEFEILRKLSPAKRKSETNTDTFHDGNDVLPDIKLWHDYLKIVMRRSDIITSEILNLVENKMLLKDPASRLSLEELCKEFDDIISIAEKSQDIPGFKIDDTVKEALLSADKGRRIEKNTPRGTRSNRHIRVKIENASGVEAAEIPLVSNKYLKQRGKIVGSPSPLASTSGREKSFEKELASRNISVRKVIGEEAQTAISGKFDKRKQRMDEMAGSLKSPSFPLLSNVARSIPVESNYPLLHDKSLLPYEAAEPDTDSLMTILQPSSSLQPTNSLQSISSLQPESIWIAAAERSESSQDLCRSVLDKYPEAAKITDDSTGYTPIMVAAKRYNTAIVVLLLPHSNLMARDQEGKTVLHHMVMVAQARKVDASFVETLKQIISHTEGHKEGKIIDMLDQNGRSPLYFCVPRNNQEIAKETVKALIEAGAWIHPPEGERGSDVFERAIELENEEMFEYLLENGAKINPDRVRNMKKRITEDMKYYLKEYSNPRVIRRYMTYQFRVALPWTLMQPFRLVGANVAPKLPFDRWVRSTPEGSMMNKIPEDAN